MRGWTVRAGQGATQVLIWTGLLKAGLVSGAFVAMAVRQLMTP